MIYIITVFSAASFMLNGFVIWKLLPKFKSKQSDSVLLDTSTLMDGRITEVVASGFLPTVLLVPRFVIAELQLLADKADHTKRERARFGLQVIKDLQESKYADISVIDADISDEAGVDEKLVKLARARGLILFTVDYNLLKVAEIEGIRVLNINELAQNIRPTRIPGETASLTIVSKGQERSQGVGYLDDGTMVVVEKAGPSINKKIDVEFTRTLQTTAGRMMFATMIKSSRTQLKQERMTMKKRFPPTNQDYKKDKKNSDKTAPTNTEKNVNSNSTRPSTKNSKPHGKLSYKEKAEASLLDAIEEA